MKQKKFIHGVPISLKRLISIVFFAALLTASQLIAQNNTKVIDNFGIPHGKTITWAFTEKLPPDGHLRKGALLKEGLRPTTFDNAVASGFQLKNSSFRIPEAFRFESQISPGDISPDLLAMFPSDDKKAAAAIGNGVLWDTMYVTYKKEPVDQYNRGFQLALKTMGKNRWRPYLYLGYGQSTYEITGPVAEIIPGQTVRLAFYYDANGSVVWDFAGQEEESHMALPGPITPGRYAPVIGDRYGSNYDQFPGVIKSVSITPCIRQPLALTAAGRMVFQRGEKNGSLSLRLIRGNNDVYQSLRLNAALFDQNGEKIHEKTDLDVSSLLTEGAIFSLPIETRLASGNYDLKMKLTAIKTDGTKTIISRTEKIGTGPLFPERFTTLMWNFNGRPFTELKAFGFTHGLDSWLLISPDFTPGTELRSLERFDRALMEGISLVSHVSARPPREAGNEFFRIARDGSVMKSNRSPMLEVLNPELIEYTKKVAQLNAKLFCDHPGFAGILANTERRDGVAPSFAFEPEQYRKDTGHEIPAEVSGALPARTIGPKRFPNGLVPDNDDLLNFYSWFWNGGDGWPVINTAIANEYRKVARPSFFSFFDPAVRVPPKWGSGGNVDVLSQWIYAVPEPLSVAGPVEELFAMAAGRGQKVMIMTQIICYRNQIAPKNKKVTPTPNWVIEKPDADFPTIPPDSLQEATWAMIAKPVKGIMYHGYGCIVELGAMKGYTYTNSETPKRLTSLLNDLVAPLGPTLNRLGRDDSPVVVLESFANALFSGYATWGWKAPDLLFLQRARLDPRVVYDETILRDGFGNAKVLYMPQCEYLTKSVCDKILDFQKKGGIIIGDEKLISAIKADVPWTVQDKENALKRNRLDNLEETTAEQNDVAAQKKNMNMQAQALREKLAPFYSPKADSSSPELITFARRWNDVDYLFAINDHRTYGDYVGQWKMTMEKGLPFEGFVTLADPDQKINAVYELSQGGKVPFTRTKNGAVQVDLKYKTNDGRMLMFLRKSIESVQLEVPKSAKRGDSVHLTFRVLDGEKKPVHALLPVEIRLFDSTGKELDGGGYACAEDGICTLEVLTNLNDPAGEYRVTAKDRASGLTVEKKFSAQ